MKIYRQEAKTGMFQSMQWATTIADWRRLYVPLSWGEYFVYFKHNHIVVYWDEVQLGKVARSVLELTRAGIPKDWSDAWLAIDQQLMGNARRVSQLEMATQSIEELKAEYERATALGADMWRLSIYVDSFDPGFDQTKIDELRRKHNLSDSETTVLLTPVVPSYVVEWEQFLRQYVAGEVSLDELREKFFWYANNYFEFGELTDEFITTAIAHAHEVAFVSLLPEQERILAVHGLSINPFAVLQTFTTWRDVRKRLNYANLYTQIRILREALRRHAIDPLLANAVLPHQVNDLMSGSISESTLREQFDEDVIYHVNESGVAQLLFGLDAQRTRAELEDGGVHSDVAELRGSVASRGTAVGRVRIVYDPSTAESAEFERGEILVTAMTRPEFMTLIKRAGAIVTDEGGITSHAAIVSREFGIPCVIGTRSATKVFKDGDMVEVDAEKGIVRKI